MSFVINPMRPGRQSLAAGIVDTRCHVSVVSWEGEGRPARCAAPAAPVAASMQCARPGGAPRGFGPHDLPRRRRALRGRRSRVCGTRSERRHRARRRVSSRADLLQRGRGAGALCLRCERACRLRTRARSSAGAREAARRPRRRGATRRRRVAFAHSSRRAALESARTTAGPAHRVTAGVWDDRRLANCYEDRNRKSSTRTVDPLGLFSKAGVWYLIGRPDGELRSFRVDRSRARRNFRTFRTARRLRSGTLLERIFGAFCAGVAQRGLRGNVPCSNDALERFTAYWPGEVVSQAARDRWFA